MADNKKKKNSGKKTVRGKAVSGKKRKNRELVLRRRKIARNVAGIILGIVALYTLVSIISYMFTWTADQSLVNSASDTVARNSGGRLGFKWARLLVTDMLGIGSFAVVGILCAASLKCLRVRIRFVRIFFIALFGGILLSLVSSYISGLFGVSTVFGEGIGGAYGTSIIDVMKVSMGPVGTVAVLLAVTILFLLFSSSRFASWISSLGDRKQSGPEGIVEDNQDEDEELLTENDPDEVCCRDEVEPDEETECPEDDEETENYPDEQDMDTGDGEPEDENEDCGDDAGIAEINVEEIKIQEGSDVPEGTVSEKYDPRLDLPHYRFPGLELLNDYSDQWYDISQAELQRNNMKITAALAEYKIQIQSISARKGPTVTLYEIVPAPGTKVAQIKRVEEDIARSIGVTGVRVITLLNTIGIEVPNDRPSTVPMKSLLNDPQFRKNDFELPVVLGYTISQQILAFDLTKAPHLLVAGATGMGKSVGLNVILTSLLYSKHPAELKFVLIDPKRVELSIYGSIKNHFLASLPDEEKPILTDTSKVVRTLKSLCVEMEQRYELLEKAHERNIKGYNGRFLNRQLNPNNGHKFLPYIVVVIDEFADLLYTAGKEIEEPISRLAAKARAVGIHLIIATQRPTTDVITGTIKANFPSRIAFKVFSGTDSRTILDEVGAQKLIGRGDMLVMIAGKDICRAQCAFVDTEEILGINNFIGTQQGYLSQYYLPECDDDEEVVGPIDLDKRDVLFDEAARLIVANQQGSASLLQRKMEIGYNRAGRLIDQLEAAGIVGPNEGSKARKVLVTDFDQLDNLLKNLS